MAADDVKKLGGGVSDKVAKLNRVKNACPLKRRGLAGIQPVGA